jgi:predicted house-cleaning NTP pyrophosphatase (Maf/HAM1 superfamily)
VADLVTLQQQLSEAESARHRLLTGSAIEQVDMSNGQRVTYTRVTLKELDSYIANLRALVAAAGGDSSYSRRRALGVDL